MFPTYKPTVPHFSDEEDTNEEPAKRRHKNSRSTTSLLSSIGNSIKKSIKNSPKANTIFNTIANANIIQYTTTEETEDSTFDNIQYTDNRRSTTTSLPKKVSSATMQPLPEQPPDTNTNDSLGISKSDRNPMKKKKKKRHRKSDSKPIASGLMSKLKQFQNRNNTKTKNKKKKKSKKDDSSPVNHDSRHKMVEVQPKPFQKKKKKKNEHIAKKTKSKHSSLKRSKSKNSRHHSKHNTSKSYMMQDNTIDKYSTSSSSLLTAGETKQISKQMKLNKRHSMHPVSSVKKYVKKYIHIHIIYSCDLYKGDQIPNARVQTTQMQRKNNIIIKEVKRRKEI